MTIQFSISRTARLILATGVALIAAGCALTPAAPEDVVKKRATERWELMVKGDFAKAYTYTTPAYQAIHPADKYFSGRGTAAQWKQGTVIDVNCPEEDKCLVKIKLDSYLVGISARTREISTVLDETWLLENGRWWYFEKL